jgi:hypothetical protein
MYLRCKLPVVWAALNAPATEIVRSSDRLAIAEKVDAMMRARTHPAHTHNTRSSGVCPRPVTSSNETDSRCACNFVCHTATCVAQHPELLY